MVALFYVYSYSALQGTELNDDYIIISWFLSFFDYVFIIVISAMMVLWPHNDKSLQIRAVKDDESDTKNQDKGPSTWTYFGMFSYIKNRFLFSYTIISYIHSIRYIKQKKHFKNNLYIVIKNKKQKYKINSK